MNRFVLPLAIFAALIALLGVGLTLNPREVPSPLIGKPAPHFELPQLHETAKTFSEKDMLGKVWVLNVWASWCVSCREEHPVLLDLAVSVPEDVPAAAVLATARAAGGTLLEDVRLFDLYRGGQVGEGRKSLGLSLSFRRSDRTLKEEEALAARDAIAAAVSAGYGGQIRA